MLEKLESFGVDVIYSEAKYLDKLPGELLRLGKITGLGSQAQQQADLFTKRLDELKAQYEQSASLAVFYQFVAITADDRGGGKVGYSKSLTCVM